MAPQGRLSVTALPVPGKHWAKFCVTGCRVPSRVPTVPAGQRNPSTVSSWRHEAPQTSCGAGTRPGTGCLRGPLTLTRGRAAPRGHCDAPVVVTYSAREEPVSSRACGVVSPPGHGRAGVCRWDSSCPAPCPPAWTACRCPMLLQPRPGRPGDGDLRVRDRPGAAGAGQRPVGGHHAWPAPVRAVLRGGGRGKGPPDSRSVPSHRRPWPPAHGGSKREAGQTVSHVRGGDEAPAFRLRLLRHETGREAAVWALTSTACDATWQGPGRGGCAGRSESQDSMGWAEGAEG